MNSAAVSRIRVVSVNSVALVFQLLPFFDLAERLADRNVVAERCHLTKDDADDNASCYNGNRNGNGNGNGNRNGNGNGNGNGRNMEATDFTERARIR